MAVSIDWGTRVITVPQSDLTFISGSLYELDVDWLRLQVAALLDDEAGQPFPDAFSHNTEVTLSGVTYARFIEFINGYTITIDPAGAYIVSCTGANHNVSDVYNNTTGPTLIVNNAAGLIVVGGLVANPDALTLNQFIALKD